MARKRKRQGLGTVGKREAGFDNLAGRVLRSNTGGWGRTGEL